MCCDHEVLKAPGVGAPLGDPASGVPRTLLPSGRSQLPAAGGGASAAFPVRDAGLGDMSNAYAVQS